MNAEWDKQKIAEHFSVHGPSLPDFGERHHSRIYLVVLLGT
jgi:hypothetical protein